MSAVEAIRSVFHNFANFRGRASRSEYWWWFGALAASQIVQWGAALLIVEWQAGLVAVLLLLLASLVWLAVAFIPNLAVTVRRLHDTGKSGWWVLITVVPYLGALVLLILLALEGQPGPNRWGAPPTGSRRATSQGPLVIS